MMIDKIIDIHDVKPHAAFSTRDNRVSQNAVASCQHANDKLHS